MDLVPIVPYTTDVIDINMGQRYDVVVNADQGSGDYWVRAVPQSSCSSNNNTDDIRGILRYDASSTADPTTAPYTKFNNTLCVDEPYASLVPYMSDSPASPSSGGDDLDVTVGAVNDLFKWYISNKTYDVPWENPTLLSIYNNDTTWTDSDHVVELDQVNEYVYFVIETSQGVPHPMHLHGHDFWILATGNTTYDSSVALNTDNPPRRDTVTLPTIGYVVIAFLTDNPGAWLMHCHIGWVSLPLDSHFSQAIANTTFSTQAKVSRCNLSSDQATSAPAASTTCNQSAMPGTRMWKKQTSSKMTRVYESNADLSTLVFIHTISSYPITYPECGGLTWFGEHFDIIFGLLSSGCTRKRVDGTQQKHHSYDSRIVLTVLGWIFGPGLGKIESLAPCFAYLLGTCNIESKYDGTWDTTRGHSRIGAF